MKLSPMAAMVVALCLAGCATTEGPREAAPVAKVEPSTTATAAGPVPPLPAVIPAGALKPIVAVDTQARNVTLLLPPTDLWERIRRGFKMKDLQTDYVRQQEQWYAQRA